MDNRKYKSWIAKLAASEDPDTADIGKTAEHAAWTLDSIRNNCPSAIEALKAERDWTEEDFQNAINEGWITIHGRLLAIWYDGI